MKNNQHDDAVGDTRSPALRPQETALRDGVDQADSLPAESCPALRVQSATAALASGAKQAVECTPPVSCQIRPWLSFFFDGTGNNMDADVGTSKHSNVAKLYRVHPEDDICNARYRVYIPGIGTYFKAVGDDGGHKPGLGMGYLGEARLNWALKEFDRRIAKHLADAKSPGATIVDINVALFGFSRGAALARAFANMLVEERCINTRDGLRLKQGNYRFRIRFMGLFDTVASVGLPLSSNTTSPIDLLFGLKQIIHSRLTSPAFARVRPATLAFAAGAAPGADPAPGSADGHSGWGGKMAIPHVVEQVRHFIAAHEIRNSFPADSVSILRDGKVVKPEHFHESVFPGVHSDVGGSYRPGEGARSVVRQEKLGLIPLHSMYQFALEAGVPLLKNTQWQGFHQDDFALAPSMLATYNYYQKKVNGLSNLGPLVNAHMALYYAWRFRSIRIKRQGNRTEAAEIARVDRVFQKDGRALDAEIAALERKEVAASRELAAANQRRISYIQSNYGNPRLSDLPRHDAEISDLRERHANARDLFMRAKAKRHALPDMSNFAAMVDMYDAQLVADAKAIRAAITERGTFGSAPDPAKRQTLRPHYKALLEAYENEFIHNKGLQDETIIAFFDKYVHDSLAGFAQDATLPSDPRVIYLGGDEKYRYAHIHHRQESEVQYASVGHASVSQA